MKLQIRIFIITLTSFMFFMFVSIGCQAAKFETRLLEQEQKPINFALTSGGAKAESSEDNPPHLASEVIDGDISSEDWDSGSGWEGHIKGVQFRSENKDESPLYIQVNLAGDKQLKKIVVYTVDSEKYPAGQYGLRNYRLEYWHGTGWSKLITENDRDKQYNARDNIVGKIEHTVKGNLFTDKIRLIPFLSNDTERKYEFTVQGGKSIYEVQGTARIMEIQVWGYEPPTGSGAKQIAKAFSQPAKKEKMPASTEILIKEVLLAYEAGYDKKNLDQIMSCFSENYASNGKNYNDIKAKANKFIEENDQIDLNISNLKIQVNPVDGNASVMATYTIQFFPKAAKDKRTRQTMGDLNLILAQDGDSWKIIRAE